MEEKEVKTAQHMVGTDTEIIPVVHSPIMAFLLGRAPKPYPKSPAVSPENGANIFSKLVWGWLSELTYTGYSRVLDFNDTYTVDENHKLERYVEQVKSESAINIEKRSHSPHWRAVLSAHKRFVILGVSFHILSYAASIGQTVVANKLVTAIQEIYSGNHGVYRKAVGYAVGELCLLVTYFFALVHSFYQMSKFMDVVKNVLPVLIYQKTIRLSSYGRAQYSSSAITSLITTDVARISIACVRLFFPLVDIPIIGAITGLLIYYIGASALIGIGLLVTILFVTGLSGTFISRYRKRSLPHADRRTELVRDTISNMRTLKLYGWEGSFHDMVGSSRKKEESLILKISGITQATIIANKISPYFAVLVTFAVMSITDRDLDPAVIFPSLTLFNMIAPLTQDFSQGIVEMSDAYVCFKRIERFLAADEGIESVDKVSGTNNAIILENATFKWLKELPEDKEITIVQRLLACIGLFTPPLSDQTKLPPASQVSGFDNINLSIKKGELIMIVGAIGSGKTNLLTAISGQMAKIDGSLVVDGEVTQVLNSWCLNATIKENILFGKDFDPELYKSTLQACEMVHDIKSFESGENTEVGEHGITLSGGQKARLALSRCVYNAKDIILLDDVLSAVDSKVGKNIMENCIAGLLAGKTRLVATHNPAHLYYADRIIFVKEGIPVIGTLQELEQNTAFQDFMQNHLNKKTSDDGNPVKSEEHEEIEEEKEKKSLMAEESRKRGSVSFDVVKSYVKFSGKHPWMNCLVVALVACFSGAAFGMQSVFLSWWSSDRFSEGRSFYIGIYAAIVTSMGISQISMIIFLSMMIFSATSNLHQAAISSVYRAPLSFFDTNPIGRIINRFTNDLAVLDTSWVFLIGFVLPALVNTLGSYVLLFVYVPWGILCLIPLFVVTFVVLAVYRQSSRESNRLTSIFRGKQLSSITENIDGSTEIVNHGRTKHFEDKVFEFSNRASYSMIQNHASMCWFIIRISLSFLPLNFVVVMLCVFHVFSLSPSSVGMLLSLLPSAGISLSTLLLWTVEIEKNLNAVERLYDYAFNLPQEAPHEIPESRPTNWPSNGQITFENVDTQYREGLPLVLQGLSLNIKGGEKIGICGRTGAGKSSLLTCLFRLNEVKSGRIMIDGVDISTLGLNDLRSNLSIIPQEPVLFKGTVRSNLDPFGIHNDKILLEALETSGSESGLDDEVDQQGNNFSLGERQLLTLARALVRRSKILALDEATANVDYKTDDTIQKVLSREFASSTVLCIAHRIQTILGYDRIVVMDRGKVKEIGSPTELYQQNGIFKSLCVESGLEIADIQKSQKFSV